MRPKWFEIVIEAEQPAPDLLIMGYVSPYTGRPLKVWVSRVYDETTVDEPPEKARVLCEEHRDALLADLAERERERCQ